MTLGLLGGCTAPNPAFGDATDGTGGTSVGEATTDKSTSESTPMTTEQTTEQTTVDTTQGTTLDPTHAESSSGDQTTNPVDTGITQPMTSDDGTDDTSPATTSTDDGSSDVGDPAAEVLLFSAPIENGRISKDGGAAVVGAAAMHCAASLEALGADVCPGNYHPLIRIGAVPFGAPALVANLDHGVSSLEGEPIAETLQDFLDGNWLVPSLSVVSAGGLEDLAGTPLATGGLSNNDGNCGGWTTEDGDFTMGDVDGGGGWFSANDLGCATPARILCLCLP